MASVRSSRFSGFGARFFRSTLSPSLPRVQLAPQWNVGPLSADVAQTTPNGVMGGLTVGFCLELVGRFDLLGVAAMGTLNSSPHRDDWRSFCPVGVAAELVRGRSFILLGVFVGNGCHRSILLLDGFNALLATSHGR